MLQQKSKKNKWIDKLIIAVLIICVITIMFYFYDRRVQECTHNPLVFAAELYEQNYEVQAIGSLTLLPLNPEAKAQVIYFNSNGTKVQE